MPAHHHCLWQRRQIGQRGFGAQERPQHAMHQPPWSAINQRQRGRNRGMGGCAQPQYLRQRQPQYHACFGIIRQCLLGFAVNQLVQINRPTQRFLRNRDGERAVRRRQPFGRICRRLIHRCAHAHDGIKQPQCGSAGRKSGNFFSHAKRTRRLRQTREERFDATPLPSFTLQTGLSAPM